MLSSLAIPALLDAQGPLLVYAGPGLTRAAGLPTTAQLASRTLKLAGTTLRRRVRGEIEQLIRSEALLDACSELERELGSASFGATIEALVDDESAELPALVLALAQLGPCIHGMISPCLDRVLERAFAARLSVHSRPSLALLQRGGWLFKTRGSVFERSTWTLTRAQWTRAERSAPSPTKLLCGLLRSYRVLFVATQFEDLALRRALEQLALEAHGGAPRHVALLRRGQLRASLRTKLAEVGVTVVEHASEHELIESLGQLTVRGSHPAAAAAAAVRPRPVSAGTVRILLAVAPGSSQGLEVLHEHALIDAALARAPRREHIELVVLSMTSYAALSRALLAQTFEFVHVIGHGSREGLAVTSETGHTQILPFGELAELFAEHAPPRGQLRCVLLAGCWSSELGAQLNEVTTISMQGEVSDAAARSFSVGFYDALGCGHELEAAFRAGRRRVNVEREGEPFPVLFRAAQR